MPPPLSFVIPARNEVETVGAVVEACTHAATTLGLEPVVVVADDGSIDDTAAVARAHGAVIVSVASGPSKARALAAGVLSTESRALCFVDADCIGIDGQTIVRLCRPVLDGTADMSVGVFDYGKLANRLVQRFPWSTGQRVLDRKYFPLYDQRLDGYNVELLINEAVGLDSGRTLSMVLDGVRQRTKAQKFGPIEGLRRNSRMWLEIARTPVSRSAYARYMLGVLSLDAEIADSADLVPVPRFGSRGVADQNEYGP